MSKEAEARVRDELLQRLYASALLATLARAQAGAQVGATANKGMSEGVAAALHATLWPSDLLLLPQKGAGSLRILRELAFQSDATPPSRDLAAGVLPLPKSEAAAVAFALGTAAAAAHAGKGTLVCVLVPATASFGAVPSPTRRTAPRDWTGAATWAEAAHVAALLALPLLLVQDYVGRMPSPPADALPAHLAPAPLYPSIPVDREDALAIYRVAYECSTRARDGLGPSHLACIPFKLRGQPAETTDTLARLEAMLRRRGAFNKSWRRLLERQHIDALTAGLQP